MTKAVVFGASGDLGRQLCTKLIDRGFQVTGVTRDVQAKTFQNNFSTELQSGALSLDMVVGSYLNYKFTNPVDLIIFCQALFQPSPLTALSTSDVFSEIEVGLIGPMILTKEYLQQFSPDDHGRLDVCYIGSTSAYAGARDTATYCTVKHGLKGFVRALNEEYKKRYNHTDDHVAVQKLGELLKFPPSNALINKRATPIKPAMPEHCKIKDDPVASYRKYYIIEKRRFATWKSPSKMPEWYKRGVEIIDGTRIQ